MRKKAFMFIWDDDKDRIRDAIERNKVTLRIIIKTKNESLLLERWLKHHLNMLEAEAKIIVLDNMSSDEVVLDAYRDYAERLIVVRFSGDQDRTHAARDFASLYQAVWDSSLFYTLIDTDEFLYLYDGKKLLHSERVISYLRSEKDIPFFSPHWLQNAYFKDDVFSFGPDMGSIRRGLMHGKPIINSSHARRKLAGSGVTLIHALQLPLSMHGESPTCFVLLHRSKLSRMRRIRSSMEKVRHTGLIEHINDFKTILTVDLNLIRRPAIRQHIAEIRELLAMPDQPGNTVEIAPGHVTLGYDGGLAFHPPELEETFQRCVNSRLSFFDLCPPDWSAAGENSGMLWQVLDQEGYRARYAPTLNVKLAHQR